ncbi:hypothetical protein ACSBR1_014963 [Camellia fascicularis]
MSRSEHVCDVLITLKSTSVYVFSHLFCLVGKASKRKCEFKSREKERITERERQNSVQEEEKLREEKLGGTRELEGNQLNFLRLKFKVTRYCLPDLSDLSILSDLLLQLSVIRRVTKLRGICLEFIFVSQPMCLTWRFRICQVVMAMRIKFKFCFLFWV